MFNIEYYDVKIGYQLILSRYNMTVPYNFGQDNYILSDVYCYNCFIQRSGGRVNL